MKAYFQFAGSDMAIDVFDEQVVTLGEAAKKLPRLRNGKKLHLSTLFRWSQRGKIAHDGVRIRLETIMIGGTKCTSLEALQRFFDRLTGETDVVPPPSMLRRDALRRHEQAMRELEKAGS